MYLYIIYILIFSESKNFIVPLTSSTESHKYYRVNYKNSM